ncbi:hypothetical protein KRP22_006541 [Phytophthora ramorum]
MQFSLLSLQALHQLQASEFTAELFSELPGGRFRSDFHIVDLLAVCFDAELAVDRLQLRSHCNCTFLHCGALTLRLLHAVLEHRDGGAENFAVGERLALRGLHQSEVFLQLTDLRGLRVEDRHETVDWRLRGVGVEEVGDLQRDEGGGHRSVCRDRGRFRFSEDLYRTWLHC